MPSDARLRNMVAEIVGRYQVLLESSASPLTATQGRWEQCRAQALSLLAECINRVEGDDCTGQDAYRHAVEIGACRATERIPRAEAVRSALYLWQAAAPVFRDVLCGPPGSHLEDHPGLFTVLDTLFQTIMTHLLHETIGYNDPLIREEILASPSSLAMLSAREQQVLACVAKAMTNHEIGRELGITETTVKRHLHNIFAKLKATSRMDAIHKAGLKIN